MGGINPNDWNSLAPHFDALLATELTPAEVPLWLHRWSDLEKIVWEARAHLKRAKSVDATNQAAQQTFNDFTVGTFSQFKFATQLLRAKLLALPAYQPAPQHHQLLRRWHNETDLFRPANVSLQAEIDLLASRYDALVRAVNEGFPLHNSTKDSLRQRNQKWLQERDSFDQLFLQLLRHRRQLAHNAGLSDYRAFRWREMGRLDYTPNDCLLFHETVAAELMPLARYLSERASDASNTQSIFATPSEFEAGMQPVFVSLDPELGTLFTQMRAGFLDLGRRAGKASGSEEWLFPVTALPYVRVDADGTNEGILLLLHECGHAFHDFLSLRDQDLFWNLGGPTEFEEFAAIALTYLALPHLHKVGIHSATELKQVVADQIREAIVKWLPTIALVDAFQHWLYAEAPENVQPADLDAQWLALTERFQPDSTKLPLQLEDAPEYAIGWQQFGLLFHHPFYYIEYALAHMGALQLWQKMDAKPEQTWQAYRAALARGNTLPLPELYAAAGARLPFESSIVREIMQAMAVHLNVQLSTVNFATQIVGNPEAMPVNL